MLDDLRLETLPHHSTVVADESTSVPYHSSFGDIPFPSATNVSVDMTAPTLPIDESPSITAAENTHPSMDISKSQNISDAEWASLRDRLANLLNEGASPAVIASVLNAAVPVTLNPSATAVITPLAQMQRRRVRDRTREGGCRVQLKKCKAQLATCQAIKSWKNCSTGEAYSRPNLTAKFINTHKLAFPNMVSFFDEQGINAASTPLKRTSSTAARASTAKTSKAPPTAPATAAAAAATPKRRSRRPTERWFPSGKKVVLRRK